jgi:hypothetical protein
VETKDWITLAIALWGAILGTLGFVLSAILGLRGWFKDRRTVKTYFLINPSDTSKGAKFVIVNNGFRPVTIMHVQIIGHVKGMRANHLKAADLDGISKTPTDSPKLPIVLNDGEQMNIVLTQELADIVNAYFETGFFDKLFNYFDDGCFLHVRILDGDGNIHNTFDGY